jgi:hypothetical protein
VTRSPACARRRKAAMLALNSRMPTPATRSDYRFVYTCGHIWSGAIVLAGHKLRA